MIIQLHDKDGNELQEWIDPVHVILFKGHDGIEPLSEIEVMFSGNAWSTRFPSKKYNTVRLLAELLKAKTSVILVYPHDPGTGQLLEIRDNR